MNVCLVSTENLPTPPAGYWGGIESIVYDLACALDKLGHSVTLIGRPGSKCPGTLLETFPDVPDKLGTEERHFNDYKNLVANFDGIIHDHSNGKKAHRIHWDCLNSMHWLQHPISVDYSNVCAASHVQAEWILKYMPAGRTVEIVPHGINAERFTYHENKEDYYLFFSVIGAYKGALDALRLAEETGVKVVFAGRDGDAVEAIKTSKLPNIDYKGEVSNEQRSQLMSEAKALIFPTGAFGEADWTEIFGFVQLEALASGTPVISSDNGACPEIIENEKTGYVCSSYAEMKRVVQDDLVGSIDPAICRTITEDKFSSERMAKDYLSLYQRVDDGEDW